ncbi:HipA family kinase [Clostridium cuniculi]|uniref:HipA family kinase n=1 Tax=Clostridium cuniculi TaxID=2548455 RepID=UPI0010554C2E|nr:HipA family kinase [Clostridium cuniculi]
MFVRKHIEELKYPLGNGNTNPIMGTINGIPYAIKTINNEQGNKTLVNELVAHMIIKKLELNIPNCEIAYIDNATYIDNNVSTNDWFTEKCYGLAFCSEFNPRTMVISSEKMIMLAKNAKWIIPKLLLLDHLLYNKDRNKGNVLLTTFKDNKELLLIDHTHIFNLETIWNSTGLKRKIEEEDYKDDWIMHSNSYLYSKFLKANPINLIDMKESVEYFKSKLNIEFIKSLKDYIPVEWESDPEEIDALLEYIIYRFEHIDYYPNLILSTNY